LQISIDTAPAALKTEAPAAGELAESIHRVVRFRLPYHAAVVVASEGDPNLLDLEGRRTWHFPPTADRLHADPFPLSSSEAIAQLESLRGEGAQYLLMPRPTLWWLDYYDEFRRHLANSYRVVHRDGTCLIVALHDQLDSAHRDAGASDGLPIPPPEMLALITGDYTIEPYFDGGRRVATLVEGLLTSNGVDMQSLRGLLDFGSGSGRVIRRWKDIAEVGLVGVDYNPYLVDWCRKALPFATFHQNTTGKRLPLEDESLDAAYSFSVFTHLDVPAQRFWMEELIRVLRPEGHLVITVHGTAYLEHLPAEDRERFEAGEMLIQDAGYSGSSACVTFHPTRYVEEVLAPELTLVDMVPGGPELPGGTQAMQDGLLLRKPA
jgi:SAM-dependent methyltransferase